MPVDVKYRTTASATGGRDGHAATKDGTFSVNLATPKELGGGGGPGNNPEQLFAAGYSACFLGAMKFVASPGRSRRSRTTPRSPPRSASARARRAASVSMSSMEISLPGVEKSAAEALVEKAHQICPYSNAIRDNVSVRSRVV